MFSVYTLRIEADGKIHCCRARINLTLQQAREFKAKRLTAKHMICTYHIVRDDKVDEFMEYVKTKQAPILRENARKDARFTFAEKMAWHGYKCADVIAFVNSNVVPTT